ncbi:hypothetical protein [Actinomadura geliboluensis]|uniref:hypothetical protein n=1 Tax=Actinomadura geliboluensis TaxID=882440 RepID=UPI0036CE88EA
MRKVTLSVALACIIAATACSGGSTNTATAPTSSPSTLPTIGADACRAYDTAIATVAQLVDGEGAPGLIESAGPDAAARVRHAAQLATGPGQAAMLDTATRIEVLADKEASWAPFEEFDDSAEVGALRTSIAAVDKLCREAGASLTHVPGVQ